MNSKFLNNVLSIAVLATIAGCSFLDKKDKKDSSAAEYYGSSSSSSGLEVPPDLTQTDPNKNITVPGTASRASGQTGSGVLSNTNVLAEPSNVKMLRDGQQRWLVVEDNPSNIWPKLISFWEKDGIKLVTANPQAGVIETDWLINYADLTSDAGKLFRGLLNKLTTSGQRDKYRVRIERGIEADTTEVYLSHQGLEEVPVSPFKIAVGEYKWVKRPTDSGLEVEVMRQIMVYLGVEEEQAALVADQNRPGRDDRSRLLIEDTDEPILVLDDGFSRAWQRVGLALDRSGVTIFGRNREQGGYVIELADTDVENDKPSLLGRIFKRKKKDADDITYRLQVRLISQGDDKTVVAVASEEGAHDNSETAISLLKQLHEQLK